MKLKPEHFDILGVFAFVYITFIAIWALNTSSRLPAWALYVLLIIGIVGLIVDVMIVYYHIVRKADDKDKR